MKLKNEIEEKIDNYFKNEILPFRDYLVYWCDYQYGVFSKQDCFVVYPRKINQLGKRLEVYSNYSKAYFQKLWAFYGFKDFFC